VLFLGRSVKIARQFNVLVKFIILVIFWDAIKLLSVYYSGKISASIYYFICNICIQGRRKISNICQYRWGS